MLLFGAVIDLSDRSGIEKQSISKKLRRLCSSCIENLGVRGTNNSQGISDGLPRQPAGRAVKRLNLVSAQLLLPAFPVVRDDVFLVAHEVFNRGVALEREINAEEFARTPTRKRERRFAQRFARNRTGVDTRAADLAKFFYKRDPLPENCGRVSSGDASRSAADDDEIEGVVRHGVSGRWHEEHSNEGKNEQRHAEGCGEKPHSCLFKLARRAGSPPVAES
jgi:hypothetical protein